MKEHRTMGRSRLLRAPSHCFVSSLKLQTVRRNTRGVPFPSLPSPGGSSPPTRLLILEVTSPVSRHPRIHGNIRNSSVSLSTQTCSLRAGRWRGFPSQEVRPTSSRHTGVGESVCSGTPPRTGLRQRWEPFHLSSSGQNRALLHFPVPAPPVPI